MQTQYRKYLSAIALIALFACATGPREVVTPSCEVPNVFEKCKVRCMETGRRPTDAWEDATTFECNCVPFDAYRLPPPWQTPGPRKLRRVPA